MRATDRPLVAACRCALVFLLTAAAACSSPDPELIPDEVLQSQLGLTDRDRVHRVTITGGERELAEPRETAVDAGDYVEFATSDWHVHEVVFELDSLGADARSFLESTDQVASPPLVQQDSRFVIDFESAPPGRYPFVLLGSGDNGRGVVIVRPKP